MPFTLNHVTLAGNLTRDPETRQVTPERTVTHFPIAANRTWKNAAGETQEEILFLDIEAWGKTGEVAGRYLAKGKGVVIQGRLKQDSWEDKDGNRRSKVKVVADSVQFLPSGQRRDEGSGDDGPEASVPRARPQARRQAAAATATTGDGADEAPF